MKSFFSLTSGPSHPFANCDLCKQGISHARAVQGSPCGLGGKRGRRVGRPGDSSQISGVCPRSSPGYLTAQNSRQRQVDSRGPQQWRRCVSTDVPGSVRRPWQSLLLLSSNFLLRCNLLPEQRDRGKLQLLLLTLMSPQGLHLSSSGMTCRIPKLLS
jgi:hypothetical protein